MVNSPVIESVSAKAGRFKKKVVQVVMGVSEQMNDECFEFLNFLPFHF